MMSEAVAFGLFTLMVTDDGVIRPVLKSKPVFDGGVVGVSLGAFGT